jgi:hypothetical protein
MTRARFEAPRANNKKQDVAIPEDQGMHQTEDSKNTQAAESEGDPGPTVSVGLLDTV